MSDCDCFEVILLESVDRALFDGGRECGRLDSEQNISLIAHTSLRSFLHFNLITFKLNTWHLILELSLISHRRKLPPTQHCNASPYWRTKSTATYFWR